MSLNTCPARGAEYSPSVNDEKKLPYHLLTPTTDNVLLDTGNHEAYFGQLEDGVRLHYRNTGMYEEFPARAEMQIARRLNAAGQVVMKAFVDEELMGRVLNMEDVHEFLPPYSIPNPLYAEGAGHRQLGKYDRFMQAMAAQYMGAAATFFCSMRENSEYKGLWETLEEQQERYHETWKEYRRVGEERGVQKFNPPYEPFSNMNDTTIGGIGNNILTCQSVLLAHQRYYDERWSPDSGEPYAVFMRRTALERTELLTLPASTNRNAMADILPDPPVVVAEDGSLVCEDPLYYVGAPSSFVTDEDGVDHWATRRFKGDARWRVPGHCAGDVPHVPTPHNEDGTDSFFEMVSAYAGDTTIGRDENGRYSSTKVMHCIGLLAAELTMYRRGASR